MKATTRTTKTVNKRDIHSVPRAYCSTQQTKTLQHPTDKDTAAPNRQKHCSTQQTRTLQHPTDKNTAAPNRQGHRSTQQTRTLQHHLYAYLATAEDVGVFAGHGGGGDATQASAGAGTGSGGAVVASSLTSRSGVQGVSSPTRLAISVLRRTGIQRGVTWPFKGTCRHQTPFVLQLRLQIGYIKGTSLLKASFVTHVS